MNIEIHGKPVKKPDPKVEPLLRRSLALLGKRKAAEAEVLLKQALEIEPKDPVLLNNLGQAYNLQGQERKAEEVDIWPRFTSTTANSMKRRNCSNR